MEANTKICVYFTKSYGPALDPPPPQFVVRTAYFGILGDTSFWAYREIRKEGAI